MLFAKRNSILLICIIFIISLSFLKNEKIDDIKPKYKSDNNYIIEIPNINLKVNFSLETTLDNGLEIHDISKDIGKPLIISGHSGPGANAYFNDLEYLNIQDEIIIYYNSKKYYYNIIEIIKFNKFSQIVVPNDENYLYLITCDKYDMQKQLIINAKLSKIAEN